MQSHTVKWRLQADHAARLDGCHAEPTVFSWAPSLPLALFIAWYGAEDEDFNREGRKENPRRELSSASVYRIDR
jgi:hypothetical protein